jgi:limonene-1,2-epoxide hydrolase
MSRNAEQIIREFGAAWERRDIEFIVDAVTEDVEYANVPLPPMVGREAVRHFITPNLTKATGVEFKYLSLVVSDDGATVLCERMDAFLFGDARVPIPVMGIFELRGDKICKWRDYSDIATFVRQMEAIGQRPGPGIAD